MSDKFTHFELENLIKDMLIDRPLFGYTLHYLSREITTKLPTAAIDSKNCTILFNADFMASLNKQQQYFVLQHECLHKLLLHAERFHHYFADKDDLDKIHYKEVANVAMDCAINQLLDKDVVKSIDNIVTYDSVCKICKKKLNEKDTAEYYFAELLKVTDENWQKAKQAMKEIAEAIKNGHDFQMSAEQMEGDITADFRDILTKAVDRQESHDKKQGTMKGDSIISLLPDYRVKISNNRVWENLIYQCMGEEPIAEVEYRYGRISRRHKDSLHYTKHIMQSKHVYIVIDTSGSVSDDELSKFLGIIRKGMRQNDTTVTLIECDYDINEEKVRKVKKIPLSKEFTLSGRGGTDLTKALDYIEKVDAKNLKNTRAIFLTDGYTPWREPKFKCSVIYTVNHDKISPIWNSAVIV